MLGNPSRTAKQIEEMHRYGFLDDDTASSGRRHDPDTRKIIPAATVEFEKYTRGIGSHVMRRFGWREGQTIGSKESNDRGLLHPIEPESIKGRFGVGYRGPSQPGNITHRATRR